MQLNVHLTARTVKFLIGSSHYIHANQQLDSPPTEPWRMFQLHSYALKLFKLILFPLLVTFGSLLRN